MTRLEVLEDLAARVIHYTRTLGICPCCDLGDPSHQRGVEAGVEGHDRDCPVQKLLVESGSPKTG